MPVSNRNDRIYAFYVFCNTPGTDSALSVMSPRTNNSYSLKKSSISTELDTLADYGCLTDEQLARLMDKSQGSIRKHMLRLADSGAVQRFPHRVGRSGRPQTVNAIPGTGWDRSALLRHQLQLNAVRLAFSSLPKQYPGLNVATWDTQRRTVTGSVPASGKERHELRPDAIALIEHEQATRPLVVFIELDRGTESYTRTRSRQTSWLEKAGRYQQADHLLLWRKWALGQAGLTSEAAYRLVVVTTSADRLAGINDALQQKVPAVGVWLARCNDVVKNGPWGPIWRRPGETGQRSFIAKC